MSENTFMENLDVDLDEENIDYELEYSEDSESEADVSLENQYYLAKSLKEDDLQGSLEAFQLVLDLQGKYKGIWGFKALKQIVKINFQLKNYEETMKRYQELLTYINSAITKNHAEKSINSILDYTSTSDNMEILQNFYETTLEALKKTKNDRLWFKTNTKLGKVYLDLEEYGKLSVIIRQLKRLCDSQESYSDMHKGTQLLEIYALQIQMHTKQKNHQQLKELFEKAIMVRSAVPHPLIMSVIRECGGKMYMRSGEFEKAYTEFFEAFKNYDESGNSRRITCLKYLLLASMLMKSAINPFDSQEAKPYKNKHEIQTMTELIAAYQNNNMKEFERIFQENKQALLADPFIEEHIVELLKNIRTKVLLLLIKPYSKVGIGFISKELGITEEDAEDLLVFCILDNSISGKIDQVNKVLVMNSKPLPPIYEAIENWTKQVGRISVCLE